MRHSSGECIKKTVKVFLTISLMLLGVCLTAACAQSELPPAFVGTWMYRDEAGNHYMHLDKNFREFRWREGGNNLSSGTIKIDNGQMLAFVDGNSDIYFNTYKLEGQNLYFYAENKPTTKWTRVADANSPTDRKSAQECFAEGAKFYRSGNMATALNWFLSAAQMGHAGAQLQVGWHYANAKGVPMDFSEAAYWYQKSALQGETAAMDNLGALYQDGLGVPRDYARARQWYQQAAALGNPNAKHLLQQLSSEVASNSAPHKMDALALTQRIMDARHYVERYNSCHTYQMPSP